MLLDWTRGCGQHGDGCGCDEGTSFDQSLEEVEWMRSACAYAQRGLAAPLQRLLERRPGCVRTDGTGAAAEQGSGFTPLHHAARAGHTECVRLLLRHGASRP
jgi:hypothetical protein